MSSNIKTSYGDGGMTERSAIHTIPIKNEGNQILRYKIVNKNLKEENRRQKRLIEELEFRLTLLTSIYKVEPLEDEMRENQREKYEEERKINEGQLSLLLFALKNTELEEEEDNETVKLTITKRCQSFLP